VLISRPSGPEGRDGRRLRFLSSPQATFTVTLFSAASSADYKDQRDLPSTMRIREKVIMFSPFSNCLHGTSPSTPQEELESRLARPRRCSRVSRTMVSGMARAAKIRFRRRRDHRGRVARSGVADNSWVHPEEEVSRS